MKPLTRKQELLAALAEGRVPNITPLTAEEILLYEQAKREAASKNPKWEDIADKPFGTTVEKTEVVPEMELNMEKPDGWNKFVHWFDVNVFNGFKVGQKFVVVLDGVEYVAPYYKQNSIVHIGDFSAELPFRITSEEDSYGRLGVSYINTNDGTEKTFALYALVEEVVTIDPVYLPKIAAVPDASGDTPTAAEFNALLAALRDAGYMAADTGL